MERKKYGVVFIIVITLLLFSGNKVNANSDNPIGELEPMNYEKLKFKQNTDYLHDEQKAEMRNTIPVKQFDINFDGSKQLPQKGDTSFVFLEAERGKRSTVAAKTSEIGLFSEANDSEKAKISIKTKSQQKTGNTMRTMIFIAMIALGMIFMFTILLPKLNQPMSANRKLSKE